MYNVKYIVKREGYFMKFIKKILSIAVVLIVIILSLVTYKGYDMYKEAISKMDLNTKVETIRNDEDFVKFSELPNSYVSAVIDVEDHRFYEHNGIDIISIFRALINDIKAKEIVEGGSTITQQLAKNMYFTQKQELVRKIAELFVTFDLEKNYNKEEIFELYVNTSYFGDGYYGIRKATKGYLNKEPYDMTLAESTLLAGIPNAPSVYAPTKNPDLAIQRQKQVIQKMVKRGSLTQSEAEELYKEIEK